MTNQGGVRMGLYAEGDTVTRARLHGVLPFSNYLWALQVSGQTLRELVQRGIQTRGRMSYAGLQIRVQERPRGEKRPPYRELVSLEAMGEKGEYLPVRATEKYWFVTNEYVAAQGVQAEKVFARKDLKISDYDAVAQTLSGWATENGRLTSRQIQQKCPSPLVVVP